MLPPVNGLAASQRIAFLEALPSPAAPENDSNGIVEYLLLLKSSKLLVASMLVLGALVAGIITFLQVPVYEAKNLLEFQSIKPGDETVGMKDSGLDISPESYLQTQVRVLQSRTLKKRIEDKLRAESPHAVYVAPNRLAVWRKALGLPLPARAKTSALPPVEVHARVVENSRIIEILCESPDPQYAARFANTMANEYIEYNIESLWDSAKRTEDWLTKQLDHIKDNLQKSEAQLQSYTEQSGLMFSGAVAVDDEKVRQLQKELSDAQTDRIAKQSAYEMAIASKAESVPQILDNSRLADYQRKIADLRQEMADLLPIYTEKNPRVVRLKAQIDELEDTLKREKENILTRISNDYQSALRREHLLTVMYADQLQKVAQADKKEIYYNILKREVESDRQLYDQLLQKAKAVGIGLAAQANNTRILDPAEVPSRPSQPDPARNAAVGILCGLVVSIGSVVGREFIDRTLRAPGESQFHLKVPELGVIPEHRPMTELEDAKGTLSLPFKSANTKNSVELVTWQDRPSPLAESFRSALASIMVAGSGSQPRVVLVTSAGLGEGKSSVVSNLGLALAEINQSVLLLDADMRKPRLHEIFGVPNSWGLSDLLREKTSLDNCPLEALARKTEVNGLHLLPSGPGTISIANLLYSSRMSQLLQRLRKEFDIVIIDTPPMLHISDARVLGRLADGAILVLRASRTTREAARTAKQRLVDDGIPVLGTILNGWDLKTKGRYGYHGYY